MRCAIVLLSLCGIAAFGQSPAPSDWIQLFNGRDLTGWTPKLSGHELGDNALETYRVSDGAIKVAYDKYAKFDNKFGHLFYKDPFSYYVLAIEYRFVGNQAPGGPGWARRNSGVMIHCQPPRSMTKDQDFPISIEVQFLGGLGEGPRPTANLCTPGTNVVRDGKLFTTHCLNSTSKTYDGDQWVRMEVLVLGASVVRHKIDGQTVMEYEMPQVGGGNVAKHDAGVKKDGELLTGGYIALQAESHPVEFRKVELLNLAGCMDAKAKNYKAWYVKSEPAECKY
jgi:hypothetical protein